MRRALLIVCAALALAGCGRREEAPGVVVDQPVRLPPDRPTYSRPLEDQTRVIVERIGSVRDPIAYGNTRGIYVIRDTKTGAEYIGVSGIGIVETGSHQSGKTRREDER